MRVARVALRAGLGLVGLVAAVAVAGAGAAWWAQTEAGERQIVRWVNGALERRIAEGGVALGSLDVGWGRIALDGLRIDGASTDGVVVIPRIAARFEPAALLTGTLHVTTLDVVSPRVRAVTTADGLDLPVFASTSPTPPDTGPTTYLPAGLTLRVDRLRLRGAEVAATDVSQEPAVVARGLDAEAALTVGHDVVDLRGLFAVWQQALPALGAVQLGADLRLVNDDLVRLAAEIGAAGARARVEGAGVGVFDPAHARLEVQATGTAGPDARRALADAFGGSVPDALADAPPLTVSVDLGGGRSSAAAALSAWWADGATLEGAELGPPVVRALATGSFDAAWQAAFDVTVPSVGDVATPLGYDASGAVRATGAAGATDTGGVAGTVTFDLGALAAAGVRIAAVHAPISFSVPPDGPPTATGTARLEGVTGPSVRVGAAEASFDVTASDVPVGVVRAETRSLDVGPDGEVPLRGRLEVNLDPEQIRLNMSWTDRRSADRAFAVIGRMNTTSGDVQVDELAVRTTREVVWRNLDPITATVADGGVDDVRFDLDSPEGHLRVVGRRIDADTIDLGAEATLSVAHAVEVASPFLAEPLPAAGGQLAARVDVSVGDGPPDLLARVTGAGIAVRDQLDRADFELRARVRHDRAELVGVARPTDGDPVALAELSVPLTPGQPEIACGGQASAVLDVPETSWEALRSLVPSLPQAPDDLSLPALRGRAWAVGDPCDPHTNVSLAFDPGVPDRPALVTVVARDDAATDTLDAGVIVAGPDGGEPWAMARGAVAHPDLSAWAADPDAATIGAWRGELRSLGLPLELGLAEVSGSLVGTATLAGEGVRLAQTAGTLGTRGATAHGLPLPVTKVAWETVGDELQATIDAANAFGGFAAQAAVGLSALHDLGGDAPLRVDVTEGMVPLLMADVFTDQLSDGAGVLRVSGGVRGTVSRPDADLALSITDGALTAVETGVKYSDITLDAQIQGRSLTIRDARMGSRPKYGRYALTDDGDVNLQVSGTVEVDEDGTIRPALRARLDRLWVLANNTGLVQISGGIGVEGATPDLDVTGRLAVDEARVRLERHQFVTDAADHLDDDIVFDGPPPDVLRTRDDEQAPSLADAVAEQIDVAVSVDVSRPVALDATVPLLDETAVPIGGATDVKLASTVQGGVRFDKRRKRSDLDGRLQAEGSVDLFGARFDIAEGTIAFAGTDPTEPNVEFALERETQGYGTVTARVTGTPSALRVEELSSDEFEDPGDVMALLLFGRPLSELGTGQSRAGAEIVQDALVNAAGAELEDLIGVELVDQVEYNAGSGLSLGWSIGTDGFFTVRLDPAAEEDENRTEAEVTWRIGRDIQAELQSGDAAVTAAWLEWERRF